MSAGIIIATAVLHNLAIEQNEDVPPVDEEYPNDPVPEETSTNRPSGRHHVRNMERTILIEQYFAG